MLTILVQQCLHLLIGTKRSTAEADGNVSSYRGQKNLTDVQM